MSDTFGVDELFPVLGNEDLGRIDPAILVDICFEDRFGNIGCNLVQISF